MSGSHRLSLLMLAELNTLLFLCLLSNIELEGHVVGNVKLELVVVVEVVGTVKLEVVGSNYW